MAIDASVFNANVMHKRLFPKVNSFNYGIYYIAIPVNKINYQQKSNLGIAINEYSYLSFYTKDHANKDNSNIEEWIRSILNNCNINKHVKSITLITMPRVFGYVFNPVSFWMCFNNNKELIAVLCEVNNTFGETHSYLCHKDDLSEISDDSYIKSQKLFHVSPFLKRKGHYNFKFSLKDKNLGIWIDYYDDDGNKQLITSLIGKLSPLNKKNLRKAFLKHPLITVKTILLIHWQAIKLLIKGIKYIPKPKQLEKKISK